MARSPKAKIKPDLLVWARKTRGYSIEDVARKLNTKKERVANWEEGDDAPTVKQLRRLAQIYKRPLAVFYLSERPDTFKVMHDFRRAREGLQQKHSPELLLEIRSAIERRELALELQSEAGEIIGSFDARISLDGDPEEIGQYIRDLLNVTYIKQRSWSDKYKQFNEWRRRVEELNVLVFQADGIPTSEMRGMSVAKDYFPVVVLNRKDSPYGRTFSLLHELAHLMINRSGICQISAQGTVAGKPGKQPAEKEEVKALDQDQSIEIFCNQVAAAALMPKQRILEDDTVKSHVKSDETWTHDELEDLARRFTVSPEAVTRRLLTFEKTTQRFYRKIREYYKDLWEKNRKKEREQFKQRSFRRNPPQDTLSKVGRPFVGLVLANYHQNQITLSDVSSYLGIRTKHIPTIEHRIMRG